MHSNQTPTYSWCDSYARTEGTLAAKMADVYGLHPHPWQRAVLEDWLAIDDDGKLLNSLCVLPVPRQNGKTGVSDPRETWGLVRRGEWILHTAQEYQTAQKAFDDAGVPKYCRHLVGTGGHGFDPELVWPVIMQLQEETL